MFKPFKLYELYTFVSKRNYYNNTYTFFKFEMCSNNDRINNNRINNNNAFCTNNFALSISTKEEVILNVHHTQKSLNLPTAKG